LTTTRSTNKKIIVSIDEVIESQKAHPQGIQLDRLFQADLERKYALVETMRLQEEQEQQEQYAQQAHEAHQEYIQEVYNYYYMMECDEMDQITEAIDEVVDEEADAWAEYLEQIEEECDFCEEADAWAELLEKFKKNATFVKTMESPLKKPRNHLLV
jgi:redox-regulated HSP33 family molecular chaperone